LNGYETDADSETYSDGQYLEITEVQDQTLHVNEEDTVTQAEIPVN